jgi:hypothetical protein
MRAAALPAGVFSQVETTFLFITTIYVLESRFLTVFV